MTTMNDIQGMEYDWLAVDAEGHVGFFSTAGGGYAPEAFLQDIDSFDSAIATLLALPPTTQALCSRELSPGLANTWKLMAERGVFAYDSDPLGGPYHLIAAPENPVAVHGLPTSVGGPAQRVALAAKAFRSAKVITEADIMG